MEFRDQRDWKQFHDPKNLAEAIAIEAAELQEIFLWKNIEESKISAKMNKVRIGEELADIINFCFLLAHETQIDLDAALLDKIKKNEQKYPVF